MENLLLYSFQVQVTTVYLMDVTTQMFLLFTQRDPIIKPHLQRQQTNVAFHLKQIKLRYSLVIVDVDPGLWKMWGSIALPWNSLST